MAEGGALVKWLVVGASLSDAAVAFSAVAEAEVQMMIAESGDERTATGAGEPVAGGDQR